jgi:hypothetical protein
MSESDKHCFVIGPIGEEGSADRVHADWLLEGIIRPVFQKDFPEWTVERSDKIATPGMVSAQIINRLHDVALVVADLSFHNPNAFYEMAIRHSVGKPIIHMILKGQAIPFDVIAHRAIKFSHSHPDEHGQARKLLRDTVEQGWRQFEEKATPELKVLADEIATIRAQLDGLRAQSPVVVIDPAQFRPGGTVHGGFVFDRRNLVGRGLSQQGWSELSEPPPQPPQQPAGPDKWSSISEPENPRTRR